MTVSGMNGLASRDPSLSIYLTGPACERDPVLAVAAADLAGSITISGPNGPAIARRLQDAGLQSPVLFDGMGYSEADLPDAPSWVRSQRLANASAALLPGVLLPWQKDDDSKLVKCIQQQGKIGAGLGAIPLFAIDARWVAKRTEVLLDALRATGQPVALVLAHRSDPLSVGGAVPGLRRLASKLDDLLILRSDHGSIGALAFGASHASVGLTTSTRHFATASMRPYKRPGGGSRVFARSLADWFLAGDIASWTAAGSDTSCPLNCCGGASLSRFFDPDLDARWHNMTALVDLADVVFANNPEDRPGEFIAACQDAVSRYGLAGFKGPENPKSQLTGWVLS